MELSQPKHDVGVWPDDMFLLLFLFLLSCSTPTLLGESPAFEHRYSVNSLIAGKYIWAKYARADVWLPCHCAGIEIMYSLQTYLDIICTRVYRFGSSDHHWFVVSLRSLDKPRPRSVNHCCHFQQLWDGAVSTQQDLCLTISCSFRDWRERTSHLVSLPPDFAVHRRRTAFLHTVFRSSC